ncbi:MAG: hypothetical protein ACPGVU_05405 [Limisphaerales bacterium]
MSLINDALKRAAEAEKRQTGTRHPRRRGPKGAEALGPMTHTKPVKSRRDMLSISPAFGLIMLIILMGGLSAFLLHSWWAKHGRNNTVGKTLEDMIITDPRLTQNRPSSPIVVTEKGVKSDDSQTNGVVTTNNNAVSIAPATTVVHNTATNSAAVSPPTSATNALPPTPLLATANPATTQPKLPAPATQPATTNSAPIPVKLPTPDPTPSGPVIVRPRAPEGPKTRDQINADLAARERAMNTTIGSPVTTEPTSVEKPTVEFPEIAVRAIIIKQNSGSADVNGKIVSMGDLVGGAELVEVRAEFIVFEMKGDRRKYYIAQ